MKKTNNEIKTGDITLTFYGCKSHRRWWNNKNNDIILYTIKIKNSTSYCLAGREIYDSEIENIVHKQYTEVNRGMSGCSYFAEPVHITMSGYISLETPIILSKKTFQRKLREWGCIPLSPVSFMKNEDIEDIIRNTIFVIVKKLKWDAEKIRKTDWGTFSNLVPLLLTFVRENKFTFDEMEIEEIRYSFSSKLKTPFGEFYLSKGRVEKESSKLKEYELEMLKIANDKIWVFSRYQKKIIYIHNKSLPYLIGWERYREHEHTPCRIDLSQLKNSYLDINDLINCRLGDLLFLSSFLSSTCNLPKATSQQLQKIQFYNCEYSEEEGILVVKPPKGMLIHPEHGELIFDEGTYYMYQVPYIQRGHD